jgi:hypothetical protein
LDTWKLVAGRIRVLRASDGALLDLQLAQGGRCTKRLGTPLAQFIRDGDALQREMNAALGCAVDELVTWTLEDWRR